jgi:deoxyadenosine/deoxycytidine kinase
MNKPLIISIDGNIGSGKSTIIKYLQCNFENFLNKNLNICFLQEPVKSWESIIDINSEKNIIQKFYENNEKYSFVFQMNAYISRLSQILKEFNNNYDVIITERSIFTDKNVFAKMLYDINKLNSIEFQVYNKWFDSFNDKFKNIKIIYIKTSPDICLSRVNKRSRTGEDKINKEYLLNCHLYHELWLNNFNKNNIVIIDGDVDINNYQFDYFQNIMKTLNNFINKFLD